MGHVYVIATRKEIDAATDQAEPALLRSDYRTTLPLSQWAKASKLRALVRQPLELVTDLRQIRSLIATDSPLSPESRLEPGQRVRIRSGSFAGYEGVIVRRDKEVRLQVNVRFMEQGVSVVIEDFQADPI